MPRRPTTPQEAQAKSAAHLRKAAQAVEDAQRILLRDWPLVPAVPPGDTLRDCAKAIEAAGCYVRRAHADNLLIP